MVDGKLVAPSSGWVEMISGVGSRMEDLRWKMEDVGLAYNPERRIVFGGC